LVLRGPSPALYSSEIKLEVEGGDRHDEVVGILWAFAQDPRDDLAAFA
jgi:hypothetical protein